jgi:hypothetical protein
MNDEWKLPNGSIIKFGDKKDEDYKGQEIDFSFLEPEQFEISEEGYKKMKYPPDPSTTNIKEFYKGHQWAFWKKYKWYQLRWWKALFRGESRGDWTTKK